MNKTFVEENLILKYFSCINSIRLFTSFKCVKLLTNQYFSSSNSNENCQQIIFLINWM